jgi:hypothetical protein
LKAHHDVSSALGDLEVHRRHLIGDLETRLDGMAMVSRDIAVKNLL